MFKEKFPAAGKPEDSKEEPHMSRREFLKNIAMVSGAVALGGVLTKGLLKLHEAAERSEQEERERTRRSEVIVVKKEEDQADFDIVAAGSVTTIPREKEIQILLNGRAEKVSVSKEQFDSLKVGDKITVSYETANGGQENIQLIEGEKGSH